MTRTAEKPKPVRKAASKSSAPKRDADLEAWLLGVPEIGPAAATLLAAYRDAQAAAKAATAPPAESLLAEPTPPESDSEAEPDAKPGRTAPPAVPRLHDVDGIEPAELSASHGRLLAAGYLTADLAGRDGLVYRLTRDGQARIAGMGQESRVESPEPSPVAGRLRLAS